MRRLPDIYGDDWIPEDDDCEDGSFSEDYDYPQKDDYDRQYDEFYR